MKIYEGRRVDGVAIVEVTSQGEKIPLTPGASLKLRVYSPTFEWGYAGGGPSQLALALLLHAYPERREDWAADWHLKFQAAVVQALPHEGWRLTGAQIARAVQKLEESWSPGKFDREAPTEPEKRTVLSGALSPETVAVAEKLGLRVPKVAVHPPEFVADLSAAKVTVTSPCCTDCGQAPTWWIFHGTMCRRCAEKAGHTYLSRFEVDPDKVLAELGGDPVKAKAFLERVRST